jgi:hypothetical protein
MQRFLPIALSLTLLIIASGCDLGSDAHAQSVEPTPQTSDLDLTDATVTYREALDLLVFEATVEGSAGATTPTPNGALDGAPVLGYVFPTTLSADAVGFGDIEGTLALAVTSHPDFDDTPLWDENIDGNTGNDGVVYHTHWVVLREDERVAGGLSVVQYEEGANVTVPATHPGMPMYLDSPGFSVVRTGNTLKVLVPAARVSNHIDFQADAVTAYMEVNTSDDSRPMLGVYDIYEILSDDLSLPISVQPQ